MISWKIGSVLNGLLGVIFIIFLITITSLIMPDSSFVRMINDYIVRTKVFAFDTQHWWRFLVFLVLMFSYFSLTTFMPLIIISKSKRDYGPIMKISTFGVYTIFGLFTPFGIFFLLGMFFIKKDLRRIRELRYAQDQVKSEEGWGPEIAEEDYEAHRQAVMDEIVRDHLTNQLIYKKKKRASLAVIFEDDDD